MDEPSIWILAASFTIVGALYASVGHAGASGYLAVMALMGIDAATMRPTALAVNVLVAAIASAQFCRAGHFSWKLAWPFLVAAPPAAFAGAALHLDPRAIRMAIGVALMFAACRMAISCMQMRRADAVSKGVRPPSRPIALASGAVIGAFSGITGTGGGIVLSPLMLLRRWATVHGVAAVSAVFILANSIAGLGGLALDGWRPDASLASLACAGCIGGAIGARIGSRHLGIAWMRGILALVLLIAATKLVLS